MAEAGTKTNTQECLELFSQLITANHILSQHTLLDGFGYVSLRSPEDLKTFSLTGFNLLGLESLDEPASARPAIRPNVPRPRPAHQRHPKSSRVYVVLQHKHGFVTWATSFKQAVCLTVYTQENAQIQQQSEDLVQKETGEESVCFNAAEIQDSKENGLRRNRGGMAVLGGTAPHDLRKNLVAEPRLQGHRIAVTDRHHQIGGEWIIDLQTTSKGYDDQARASRQIDRGHRAHSHDPRA
ncbi:hypothetical protein K469DRAFT_746810 [Zopfia rhizophila CBS 207.26]|uniref:Uncharacterized protein n=1 Tax=Zopfia rhizophila CBS 207.26 TaxID=1314779 RepID=A0A6A6EN37_9PEZI|nr:hypothetical protein K469DRAFT_746810 [Zopfia rhizophila CBS 207.26]